MEAAAGKAVAGGVGFASGGVAGVDAAHGDGAGEVVERAGMNVGDHAGSDDADSQWLRDHPVLPAGTGRARRAGWSSAAGDRSDGGAA